MLVAVLCAWLAPRVSAEAETVLYSTDFEFSSGFDSAYELVGQGGWIGYPYSTNEDAVNASGIISNGPPGNAQEAFVGYFEPNPLRSFVSVWHPLNVDPGLHPQVRFEVLMTIYDSSTNYPDLDNFRWSVYNAEGDRLFAVDFDNYNKSVTCFLDDDTNAIPTGQLFTNDAPFHFSISMDFASNRWSAAMEGTTFITDLPIATNSAPLNLGDVDAVWAIYNTNYPGDNFMTFDNYRVLAVAPDAAAGMLKPLGMLNGGFVLRVFGSDLRRYAVDASTNLANWTPLKTNFVTGGFVDFVDQSAAQYDQRFYRTRIVP